MNSLNHDINLSQSMINRLTIKDCTILGVSGLHYHQVELRGLTSSTQERTTKHEISHTLVMLSTLAFVGALGNLLYYVAIGSAIADRHKNLTLSTPQ